MSDVELRHFRKCGDAANISDLQPVAGVNMQAFRLRDARSVHKRGKRSWKPTLEGLEWLAAQGFRIDVATRRLSGESEAAMRAGFDPVDIVTEMINRVEAALVAASADPTNKVQALQPELETAAA